MGRVNDICLNYAQLKDNIRTANHKKIIYAIDNQFKAVSELKRTNQQIRSEYDSTLLEEIAGQPRANSINSVSAQQAKQQVAQNNREISQLKTEIDSLKQQLLSTETSQSFISFLNNQQQFSLVKDKYNRAFFWYPSIQLGFQSLFLLPLIFIASLVHRIAQNKRYGLIALISWHLLVIFCIPLIIKLFEFLQIGIIFRAISDFLEVIFLNLLFLVHYVYILLVPLIGFGIIKLLQKIVFNPKVQAAKRIQKSRCVRCAKKIRRVDNYCPHCGYYQYVECINCHQLTYKYLPHCNRCGHLNEI